MTDVVDKAALAARFGKAADSYDQYALLQKDVGRHLLQLIPEQNYNKGLDLGCGSGFFLPDLRKLCHDLTAVDISLGMLTKARTRAFADLHICGDAEALPFVDSCFDFVFSSLAIQWCNDLAQAFKEIKRVLTSQGYGLFATLTKGSLSELNEAWAAVDDQPHVNQFLTQEQITRYLDVAQVRCVQNQIVSHTLFYNSVSDILKSLKGIGASQVNGNRQQGLLTRKQLVTLENAYEQYRQPNGLLPITYHVCYGVICR